MELHEQDRDQHKCADMINQESGYFRQTSMCKAEECVEPFLSRDNLLFVRFRMQIPETYVEGHPCQPDGKSRNYWYPQQDAFRFTFIPGPVFDIEIRDN